MARRLVHKQLWKLMRWKTMLRRHKTILHLWKTMLRRYKTMLSKCKTLLHCASQSPPSQAALSQYRRRYLLEVTKA